MRYIFPVPLSGGFPCQDISAAGKGAGIDGKRSGLWSEFARIICEVRPRYAFVENSPLLTSRGLDRVLGDLAEMRDDAGWCVLGANDVGAPHRRKRIWIVATDADGQRELQSQGPEQKERRRSGDSGEESANAQQPGLEGLGGKSGQSEKSEPWNRCTWWDNDPADLPDADKFDGNDGRHGASEICRERSEASGLSGSEAENLSDSVRIGGQIVLKNCPGKESERSASNVGECVINKQGKSVRQTTEPFVGRVAHGVAYRVDRLKAIGKWTGSGGGCNSMENFNQQQT